MMRAEFRIRPCALLCAALLLIWGCAGKPQLLPVLSPSTAFVPSLEPPSIETFWKEAFDELDDSRWQEVEVSGQTDYSVVDLDGRRCLKAESRGGASIVLSKFRFDPDKHEWLSWEWRVDRFVDGEALEIKSGSDAAARVYVYFDTKGFPWQRHNIDYVWSATLPVGTIMDSAFSKNSKIVVAQSGTEHIGEWQRVTRNLEDDYQRCFGRNPPDVLAIGLMTDTDNTSSYALAYYDDLRITRAKPPTRPLADGEI